MRLYDTSAAAAAPSVGDNMKRRRIAANIELAWE